MPDRVDAPCLKAMVKKTFNKILPMDGWWDVRWHLASGNDLNGKRTSADIIGRKEIIKYHF